AFSLQNANMVGIEDEHDRLLIYRPIRLSDFSAQAQYLVEFRVVLERSRYGIDPIGLRLKVLDMQFQIGKLLLHLDEPPFKSRGIGHGHLRKRIGEPSNKKHCIFPRIDARGKGKSSAGEGRKTKTRRTKTDIALLAVQLFLRLGTRRISGVGLGTRSSRH
ncbi:MAG: hypothetical protein ACQESR_29460, partial [Planctomycetota bacterium]